MNKNKLVISLVLAGALGFSATASANTMLGAFIKHDGWSLADIDNFNADSSKSMAVTTLFSTFDMHWGSLNIQASNIVSRGATPMISLMPYGQRHPDMLAAIASGAEDGYINSWIGSFKAWRNSYPEGKRPSVMLRFGHEFNATWYPWGNDPEAFKAAWRHIYALFEAADVNDSVEWVWCASATDVDDYNDVTAYYPGSDVVDWVGLDGYNWGSNYAWTSWRSFDEVFSSAYVNLVENFPEKPLVIAEVGSAEPHDLPDPEWGQNGDDRDADESKEVWVEDMLQRIVTDYPAVRAISWFNINKELSWALNGKAHSGLPNSGLNAYNQGILDAHFISSFNSAKSTLVDEGGDTSEVVDSSPGSDTDISNTGAASGNSRILTEKQLAIAEKKAAKKAALAAKKARIAKKRAEARAKREAARAKRKALIAERKATKNMRLAEKKARISARRAAKKAAFAEKKAQLAELRAERKAVRMAKKAKREAMQRALAESRKPRVIGEQGRQREANGFREINNMPAHVLEKIRKSRLKLK